MKSYSFIVLIALVTSSCSSAPRITRVPLLDNKFSHEPEFRCEEHYGLGEGSKRVRLNTFCTNQEWSVSITIGKKSYQRTKYAELYGPGGGGIWKLYQTDIDSNGETDFVAALYNGSSSGSDIGQVVFILPEQEHLHILSHWTHNFEESKITKYYKHAQPVAAQY